MLASNIHYNKDWNLFRRTTQILLKRLRAISTTTRIETRWCEALRFAPRLACEQYPLQQGLKLNWMINNQLGRRNLACEQYPLQQGLKPDFQRQPLLMLARACEQYPLQQGLKHVFNLGIACFVRLLASNIHYNKDWNPIYPALPGHLSDRLRAISTTTRIETIKRN